MSTGRARTPLAALLVMLLGGCASSEGPAILSAAELDSMIHVEVERFDADPAEQPEAGRPDDTVVAALQP